MHRSNDVSSSEPIASPIDDSKGSDAINKIGDDKMTNAINKEVDKILGPTLERTNSGCNLKITAPLRTKKRQYRSQEALPLEESLIAGSNHNIINILPSQSEIQINDLHNTSKLKIPRPTILHENQRAEIVASVTERLYSKLKKKEEVAVAKMESMVDRKIVEPLSELRICTNARKRLIELSQKAIRNKRKVLIPAQTQTKVHVTRIKDQAIDIQTDLEAYSVKNCVCYSYKRDVSTETLPMTPRYKEIAVGSEYGSLNFIDKSTTTLVKQSIYKNSCMMTEKIAKKDCSTQTQVIPPPRRRKRGSKKSLIRNDQNNGLGVSSSGSSIKINISQTYTIDSESQSSEDNFINVNKNKSDNVKITPDLLTNHTPDTNEKVMKPEQTNNNDPNQVKKFKDNDFTVDLGLKEDSEDFSDHEDYLLPRVLPDSSKRNSKSVIKEIILGRNKNMYPYNIVLSPAKYRDLSKRIVTFKDYDCGNKVVAQSCFNEGNNINIPERTSFTSEETLSDLYSPSNVHRSESMSLNDSIESDKAETDDYLWKKDISESKPLACLRRDYVPVYRSQSKQETFKKDPKDITLSDSFDKSYRSQYISEHVPKKGFLEDRRNSDNDFGSIERKIFEACNNLEMSVNKYSNYIESSTNKLNEDKNDTLIRTPTKYLQHLIRIRREMVKIEQFNNNSVFQD